MCSSDLVDVHAVETAVPSFRDIATLFGESASRVIVTVNSAQLVELTELAASERVAAAVIGRVGRGHIRISVDGAVAIDEPVDRVEQVWAHAIGRYFESQRAIA